MRVVIENSQKGNDEVRPERVIQQNLMRNKKEDIKSQYDQPSKMKCSKPNEPTLFLYKMNE